MTKNARSKRVSDATSSSVVISTPDNLDRWRRQSSGENVSGLCGQMNIECTEDC